MDLGFIFFFNSILLGIGLAMDAFSVSLANGLSEPDMNHKKMCVTAGIFAVFQALMPMIGWICVHTVVECFEALEGLIPWIALILLCYIGVSMLREGTKNNTSDAKKHSIGLSTLLIQGIATSIDALSVGFTISDYDFATAILSASIIAAVTFIICIGGLAIGKKAGTALSKKASILGGAILIFIGLEIFITGII